MSAPPPSALKRASAASMALDAFHVELSSDSSSDGGEGEAPPPTASSQDASERLEIVTTQRPFKQLTFELRNPIDRFYMVEDEVSESVQYHMGRDPANNTSLGGGALARKTSVARRSFVSSSANALALSSSSDHLPDYTLYSAGMTKILLSAVRVTGHHWSQLRHRSKHADLEIYSGNNYENLPPLATLRGVARSSRVMHLERFNDGGVVYTLTKDKIMGHRVFYIGEGRNNALCRMVLIVRRGRAVVKFMTDPEARSFNATCLEYVETGGAEGKGVVRIARGMDLCLALACLCVAERFERYAGFVQRSNFLN